MKCKNCDKELMLSNNFSYEDYGIMDKLGVIDIYYCLDCGYEIEVYCENDKIVNILEIK